MCAAQTGRSTRTSFALRVIINLPGLNRGFIAITLIKILLYVSALKPFGVKMLKIILLVMVSWSSVHKCLPEGL